MGDVRRTLHDLASLAARMGVGGIFFANGWHKLEAGLTATGQQFATLDAPAPQVWAAVTMLTELIGGALLVAGLAVGPCGLLLFAEALAVFVIASGDQGLPLTGGDVNLIVALGAASILLSVGGAGRLSVDHMVVIKRREAAAADDFAADTEADDVLASWRETDTTPPGRELAPGEAAGPKREKGGDAPREDGETETHLSETHLSSPAPAEPAGDDTAETAKPSRGGRTRSSPAAARPSTATDAPIAEPGDTLVAGARDSTAAKPRRTPRKPASRPEPQDDTSG
ncbi:DoxX family membrane protein [Spongiactinospora sp. TRM90649]|uniref:DoxX family protein n=1 Tax=Spongiactinospora sp. TRM90649 TaxID=3031114 RepID=UPI0023F7EAAE|nr:DoxX family membrane protein [Spongiactinospora sp. TRM90649]MDF5755364.1 DoxX family membrane protein [Spongiactinospora sp. TRM90649]